MQKNISFVLWGWGNESERPVLVVAGRTSTISYWPKKADTWRGARSISHKSEYMIKLVPVMQTYVASQKWIREPKKNWQPNLDLAIFCQNQIWLPNFLVSVWFLRIPQVAPAKTTFGCQIFFLATKSGFGMRQPIRKCNRTLVDSLFLN